MKILSNPDLVREIRNCSDLTNNRLWVAVPYIGSWNSVAKIIGNRWVKNSQLKVRLLTDIEERTAFSSDTLKIFRGHALVKHLLGLHAKIYVFDEKAIITSANLTRAAFMKREEVGVLLEAFEMNDVVKMFERWWEEAIEIKDEQWIASSNGHCQEETQSSVRLKDKNGYDLPASPDERSESENLIGVKNSEDFIDIIRKYEKLRIIYEGCFPKRQIQPDLEIYLEIDKFLNFLFHEKEAPSKYYAKEFPKQHNRFNKEAEQTIFIKENIEKFKKYFEDEKPNCFDEARNQKEKINSLLIGVEIEKLTEVHVREIFSQIYSVVHAPYGNRLNEISHSDKLPHIHKALKILFEEKHLTIPQRMAKITYMKKGIGWGTISELVANLYPDQFPKINNNSLAGLHYLGFKVPLTLN